MFVWPSVTLDFYSSPLVTCVYVLGGPLVYTKKHSYTKSSFREKGSSKNKWIFVR